MSDYEYHKGTLRKVEPLEGETVEDVAARILDNNCKAYFREDVLEDFREYFWAGRYIIVGKDVYAIENHVKGDAPPDGAEVSKNADGSYDFVAYFYNGGTCFQEAIEEAMEELNENGK